MLWTNRRKKKEIACWGLLYIQTANSRRCRGTFFLSEFSYINLISICIVSAPTGLSQHLHASSCFPALPSPVIGLAIAVSFWMKPNQDLAPITLRNWHQNLTCVWHCCGMSMQFCSFCSVLFKLRPLPKRNTHQMFAVFRQTSPPSGPRCIKNWECDLPSTGRRPRNQTGSWHRQKLKNCCQEWLVWMFRDVQSPRRFCQTSSNICPKPSSNSVFATPTPRKWQWISRNESDEKSSTFKHLQYLVSDLYSICTTLHCTLQTGYNIIYNFPNRQENVELFQQVLPSFVAKLVRDLASPASRILQWHAMVSNSFAFCCHKPCLTEQTLHICSPRVHAFVL